MSQIQKIVGVNILLLLLYNIAIGRDDYAFVVLAFAIAFHAFVLFVIAMIFFAKDKGSQAKAFLLSFALVLTIGFPLCWVGAM